MRRTTIADLPLEVLLECFSFMELKSLIISRGVCAGWRELVPKAPLNARRQLLDLYYGIVNTDCSLKTRDYALNLFSHSIGRLLSITLSRTIPHYQMISVCGSSSGLPVLLFIACGLDYQSD